MNTTTGEHGTLTFLDKVGRFFRRDAPSYTTLHTEATISEHGGRWTVFIIMPQDLIDKMASVQGRRFVIAGFGSSTAKGEKVPYSTYITLSES